MKTKMQSAKAAKLPPFFQRYLTKTRAKPVESVTLEDLGYEVTGAARVVREDGGMTILIEVLRDDGSPASFSWLFAQIAGVGVIAPVFFADIEEFEESNRAA